MHIIGQLDDVQMDFLTAVVPEAILCTKETGERPRLAAYNLLVEMGNAVMRWSPDAEQGNQHNSTICSLIRRILFGATD